MDVFKCCRLCMNVFKCCGLCVRVFKYKVCPCACAVGCVWMCSSMLARNASLHSGQFTELILPVTNVILDSLCSLLSLLYIASVLSICYLIHVSIFTVSLDRALSEEKRWSNKCYSRCHKATAEEDDREALEKRSGEGRKCGQCHHKTELCGDKWSLAYDTLGVSHNAYVSTQDLYTLA